MANNNNFKTKTPNNTQSFLSDTSHVDYNQKVLEVKNLKKHFAVGTGKKRFVVRAVDNVSFDIHKREVFGVVGESGCGKTTTGRTIIKLYQATDGIVKLNGNFVVGGYESQKENIKKIKKEAKIKKVNLYPGVEQKLKDLEEFDQKIEDLEYQIIDLRNSEKLMHDEVMQKTREFRRLKYELADTRRNNIDQIKYNYKQEVKSLKEQTKNKPLEDYRRRLKIEKESYKNKREGLQDSAALDKEEINKRLEILRLTYEDKFNTLKETYGPLILQGEEDRKSKADIKEELIDIKSQKTAAIFRENEVYKERMLELKGPNRDLIKDSKKAITTETNAQVLELKNKIKEIKKTRKTVKIKKSQNLTKDEVVKIKKLQRKIDEEKEELIKQEKAKIRKIKELNKSKEAKEAVRDMQMIFQDPIASLNPRMTVKDIIAEGLIIRGDISKSEIDRKVDKALELVGLSKQYKTRYPHEFSGGQRQRIGIARALIMQPSFIIADEPISALDVSIRAQVINLLTDLKDELDLTILFIAHDLSVVRFFCDRIAVMYFGKIVEIAQSEELFKNPMHPYTISLLSAVPQPDPEYEKGRKRITYDPKIHNYRKDKPSLREIAPGHLVFANEREFNKMKEKYNKNLKEAN